MSYALTAGALRLQVSTAEKMVLWALTDCADDDGECYPGHEYIATATGFHVKTIPAIMGRLIQRGVVEVLRGHSRWSSTRYRLHLEAAPKSNLGLPQELKGNPGLPQELKGNGGLPLSELKSNPGLPIDEGKGNLALPQEAESGLKGNPGFRKGNPGLPDPINDPIREEEEDDPILLLLSHWRVRANGADMPTDYQKGLRELLAAKVSCEALRHAIDCYFDKGGKTFGYLKKCAENWTPPAIVAPKKYSEWNSHPAPAPVAHRAPARELWAVSEYTGPRSIPGVIVMAPNGSAPKPTAPTMPAKAPTREHIAPMVAPAYGDAPLWERVRESIGAVANRWLLGAELKELGGNAFVVETVSAEGLDWMRAQLTRPLTRALSMALQLPPSDKSVSVRFEAQQ